MFLKELTKPPYIPYFNKKLNIRLGVLTKLPRSKNGVNRQWYIAEQMYIKKTKKKREEATKKKRQEEKKRSTRDQGIYLN